MKIIHGGAVHVQIPAHVKADGTEVVSHWRPSAVPSTYPEDAPVMGAEPPQGFAPFSNPNERDTLPSGKAS